MTRLESLVSFFLSYLFLFPLLTILFSNRLSKQPKRRINRRLGRFESLFVNNIVSSGKRKRKDKKKLTNDSRRVASRASSVVETRWTCLDPCYSAAAAPVLLF